MGEEAKQEQPKAESQQEKKEEKKEEEKPADEPKPQSPFVLFVDLHCVGCAKKIERSVMKIRGVEGVVVDMAQNQVTVKGIVEPQAVCTKILKKTKRRAKVLSPLPAAEGEPMPEVVSSQVTGLLVSVELNVNMHCEGCAEQLKRKILKMRGVRTAVTELSTGKVTVTGTMDAEKLADYVYRRTKKQAKIVPQAEPQAAEKPDREEKKEAEEAEAEEDRKKEGNGEKIKAEEEKAPDQDQAKKEGEEAKEEGGETENSGKKGEGNKEEKVPEAKKELEGESDDNNSCNSLSEEESMRRMMHYYHQPIYVMERIPAPQLFSDENPNACCIS